MSEINFDYLIEKIEKAIKKMSKKSKIAAEFTPKDVPFAGFWKTLASVFGAGYSPVASGTVGSFLTYIILAIIFAADPDFTVSLWYILVVIALMPIGAIICQKGEDIWGHDSGKIVFDELVGMFITFVFVPVNLFTLFGGFLLFRIFDIIKVPPGRTIDEKMPGGWGVLLDDVMAGIYANLVLQIIVKFAMIWRGV
ncbi:MAG: phosphatidylglycerophosphatase A [Candidatus Zixiibacteriota bacterium]